MANNIANDTANPILKALPPEVDYLSYLTILEYNLSAEQLPLLHDVLQDTTLTSNIGWDLVHLLVPLLPASQTCLRDVARLGNPREVVLKVTELLETLALRDDEEEQDQESDGEPAKLGRGEQPAEEMNESDERADNGMDNSTIIGQTPTESQPSPSKAQQFSALLEMLAMLHPRIKTKHPSRFLSTSLQAILPAYSSLSPDTETTDAVLHFIKTFSGTKRPKLPPRRSSGQLLTQPDVAPSAPDPEGQDDIVSPEENRLQHKLLQSFLTFAVEGYMSTLPSRDNVAGLAWSSRLQEALHPEKNIPGRRTIHETFSEDESLHARDSVLGQMLALSRDLELKPEDLVRSLIKPEISPHDDDDDEDEYPSSASDVPLSNPGCLYLLSATLASALLFQAPAPSVQDLSIYPTYSSILSKVIGNPTSPTIGTEPSALIDSVLFLGLYIFETSSSSSDATPLSDEVHDDTAFTPTLQTLSLLSLNTPHSGLRYSAHILTSQLLHANASDYIKLGFIKDTLQHCPYENLKAEAVGWLKNEILSANPLPSSSPSTAPIPQQKSSKPSKHTVDECADERLPSPPATKAENTEINVFSTPTCLHTLTPYLLPSVSPSTLPTQDFLTHESFFLSVLNLLYLLQSRKDLAEKLDLRGLGLKQWVQALDSRILDIRAEGEDVGLMQGMLAMVRVEE